MTREEALTRLRLRSHQAFCEYVENGNQENEEAALDVLAYDMAIAALRATQLDENGLMPCGCGGKPRLYGAYDDLKVIQCRECGVSTLYIRPDNVQVIIDDWNAAMGYKGGAE